MWKVDKTASAYGRATGEMEEISNSLLCSKGGRSGRDGFILSFISCWGYLVYQETRARRCYDKALVGHRVLLICSRVPRCFTRLRIVFVAMVVASEGRRAT